MLKQKADNMTMSEYQNIFWMQQKILNAIVDEADQPKTIIILQKCMQASKENHEGSRMAVLVC